MAAEYNTNAVAPALAGASAGTGLIALASLIPNDHHTLRALFTYAAPSISIAFGIVWAWATSTLSSYLRRRSINRALNDVRKIRDDVYSNPNSTKQHKSQVQRNVEKLEIMAVEIVNDDTESIRAALAGSTTNPS